MDKKYLFTALVLLFLAILAGVIFWFSIKSKPASIESPVLTASPMPTLIPTIEPTVLPSLTATISSEKPEESALEQIKQAFAQKYEKPISEIEVTISKDTGIYASGGIKFAGEIGGAMWLAYDEDGNWQLVFDGQGTVPCSAVDPYDFPIEIVPECWDEEAGKLVTRS
ncbi:MAG TPA: hypothetical protein VMW41_02295 [Candidatus Bathyarchaeia archaeon]|nr:hypothetical protein [Candidatus Bathyarchaeia archaeon]